MKTSSPFIVPHLSWSSLSLFAGLGGYPADKEAWYKRYVLGIKDEPNKELVFGSMIDRKIQDDLSFLPKLRRYEKMQYKLEARIDDSIPPILGFADGVSFSPTCVLADYKTGKHTPKGEAAWSSAKADKTGQLTLYALMLYLQDGIKPEDVKFIIHWLPTQENNDFSISLVDPVVIHTFETRRTMGDIAVMGKKVKEVYGEMEIFVNGRQKG